MSITSQRMVRLSQALTVALWMMSMAVQMCNIELNSIQHKNEEISQCCIERCANSEKAQRQIIEYNNNKSEEKKPFKRMFPNAFVRILDFLILNRDLDYTGSDIARKTNLTYMTVVRELQTLLDEGIVKVTRKLGRSNMYKLIDSQKVRWLVQYVDDSIKMDYELMTTIISSSHANANIPQPYNQVDVLVWTRRILKSICKENKKCCFCLSDFILSDDEVQGTTTKTYYERLENEKSFCEQCHDDDYKIVKYCLEELTKKQVLIKQVIVHNPSDGKKYIIYCKTDLLHAISTKINNIHLPVIDKLLEEYRASNNRDV
ncbi:MAG TPA: helix-turn-helix domain-containing protein [Nitrososphaeraceae archaeon]|nr:helix-turn-helix domain-containing protein [Nitrososphaeraceae archaeon]